MTDVWHPFTQLRGFRPRGDVVSARGAWLHLADGRRVFDGISSWWVTLHGHGHPKLVEALCEQARAFDQVILADFRHGPAAALTARLSALLPGDVDHVFFSDDGSTAVEVALKMAWQAQRLRGEKRHRLVALEGGYHGDTLGAMRVGARGTYSAFFDDLLGETTYLPFGDAEAAEAFFAAEGHEVALCIVEPLLQGAGGMRMASPEWLRRLADAARKAGVVLIADEVATGFGRTGTLWACEQAGVVPDLVCLSKGITGGMLPLGVTGCRRWIHDLFLGEDRRRAFLHGHSYTGNPIACAVALASLDVLEEEGTVGRFRAMEEVWRAEAPAFAAIPRVRNVRYLGGIFAFDVSGDAGGYHDPIGRRIQDAAFARGLYVRPLGDVVYLMPPACATHEELREACAILRASIPAD